MNAGRWQPEELAKLERYWCNGYSVTVLADVFNRKPGSVTSKLKEMGLFGIERKRRKPKFK